MKLFTEVRYTVGTTIKATDYILLRAWEILCEKHTKKLSADAIRAFMSVSHRTMLLTSSSIANQLCDPFDDVCDGAALYPDEFQDWESDALSLCERDGFLFSTTFQGAVMQEKMLAELNKKHAEYCVANNLNKSLYKMEV